jgi:hypothetical protein
MSTEPNRRVIAPQPPEDAVAAVDQCPGCGKGRPIELQMTTRTGQVLTMLSCPRCELRTWTSDGEPVPMDQVLKLTSGNPDFAMSENDGKPRRASPRR